MILVAAAGAAAMAVVEPVRMCASPALAQGSVIRDIRVVGQPPRRAGDGALLPALQCRRRLRCRQGRPVASSRCSPPACSPTCASIARASASVVTVVENPVINQVAFEGNREVDKDTLVGRGPAQAARRVHARQGAGRRAAHPRCLSPPGSLCGAGRAQDHRARQQPREPRVRDQRGRGHQGQGHQLHRQPRLLRQPAARHHHAPRSRACSTSSRAPTSTIPTGCRSIASCCGSTT